MYRHVKTDHVFPGIRWGDFTDEEVDAMSSQDQAIMAHLVDQGIYERTEDNHDESTEYQAEKAEDDYEGTEDQATGGGSNTVQW